MRVKGIILLISVSALAILAAHPAVPSRARQERLFYALADIDFGSVYVEDGAADGSVTEEWRLSESGPEVKAFAQVKAVVNLRDSALPLLIEHLDDVRPTQTQFNGKAVPLGVIALDILSHIIGPNSKVFDPDCADDGLGACVNSGYYFRPDTSLAEMSKVKEKWLRLYRRGAIKFRYPMLW
jgi:hypothetical protein